MAEYYRSTVVEIDLDAMTHNINFFRNKISNKSEIIAIVKADAYGHGVLPIVKHLKHIGVQHFAVAFLDEAISLRKAGIDDHLLILGYTPNIGIEKAAVLDVSLTVFSKNQLDYINEIGERLNKKINVHIKIDTGMGRIGIFPEDFQDFYNYLRGLEWIELEGIFTHFATADEKDKSFTHKQHQSFLKAIEKVNLQNKSIKIHLSNSAAMLDLPEIEQDMVRLGIGLYGLLPSDEVSIAKDSLRPVMTIKTEVSYLKTLTSGKTVSYGATYKTDKDTVVATIPIGYADGLPRNLSNKGYVLVNGEKAPIIGRVCMDQTMVNVTHIPNVQVGTEVMVIGSQRGREITLDDYAKWIGTISYEIATMIGKRIPRIYKRGGKTIEIINTSL